jgi:hypothetical protein
LYVLKKNCLYKYLSRYIYLLLFEGEEKEEEEGEEKEEEEEERGREERRDIEYYVIVDIVCSIDVSKGST